MTNTSALLFSGGLLALIGFRLVGMGMHRRAWVTMAIQVLLAWLYVTEAGGTLLGAAAFLFAALLMLVALIGSNYVPSTSSDDLASESASYFDDDFDEYDDDFDDDSEYDSSLDEPLENERDH